MELLEQVLGSTEPIKVSMRMVDGVVPRRSPHRMCLLETLHFAKDLPRRSTVGSRVQGWMDTVHIHMKQYLTLRLLLVNTTISLVLLQ